MIRISANAYYEDSQLPDVELCLDELFYISKLIDSLLKTKKRWYEKGGNDSNLLIVFYVQIMPDDFVMQLHR
ncbi:hypothetical protein V6073_23985, partial [Klebsiella pneumoniae]